MERRQKFKLRWFSIPIEGFSNRRVGMGFAIGGWRWILQRVYALGNWRKLIRKKRAGGYLRSHDQSCELYFFKCFCDHVTIMCRLPVVNVHLSLSDFYRFIKERQELKIGRLEFRGPKIGSFSSNDQIIGMMNKIIGMMETAGI